MCLVIPSSFAARFPTQTFFDDTYGCPIFPKQNSRISEGTGIKIGAKSGTLFFSEFEPRIPIIVSSINVDQPREKRSYGRSDGCCFFHVLENAHEFCNSHGPTGMNPPTEPLFTRQIGQPINPAEIKVSFT